MSRLATITGNVQASVAFKHRGAGRIVEEYYVESQTKLSYLDSSGNAATPFPRFDGQFEMSNLKCQI